MPPFYVQQMTARTYEPLRIASSIAGCADLSVTATRSQDARTVVLNVVNPSAHPVTATISLTGFGSLKSPVQVWTLAGPLAAANPPIGPSLIHPVESALAVSGGTLAKPFPAHSFVVMKMVQQRRIK